MTRSLDLRLLLFLVSLGGPHKMEQTIPQQMPGMLSRWKLLVETDASVKLPSLQKYLFPQSYKLFKTCC